jgi:hypothetical protein
MHYHPPTTHIYTLHSDTWELNRHLWDKQHTSRVSKCGAVVSCQPRASTPVALRSFCGPTHTHTHTVSETHTYTHTHTPLPDAHIHMSMQSTLVHNTHDKSTYMVWSPLCSAASERGVLQITSLCVTNFFSEGPSPSSWSPFGGGCGCSCGCGCGCGCSCGVAGGSSG